MLGLFITAVGYRVRVDFIKMQLFPDEFLWAIGLQSPTLGWISFRGGSDQSETILPDQSVVQADVAMADPGPPLNWKVSGLIVAC
jgi:hypothetical protein